MALSSAGAWIEAAPAALDAINAAGVPVVLVDRMLKGGDFTSWIGPDNYAIGEGIGDYIVKRLNGEGQLVASCAAARPTTRSAPTAPERHAVGGREAPAFKPWRRRRISAAGVSTAASS